MADWSAIRINKLAGSVFTINDDIILYVATSGDDVNGDGSFGNPYYSPHRALEYLKDKIIGATASVEINCAAGIYNFTEKIFPTHGQGERIRIIGAEPEVYKIRGCRGFTAGVSGDSDPYKVGWCHMKLITSIDDGEGGMTTEHGLTAGDVGKWMLIFQTTQETNPDYPIARKNFLGSWQDNKARTGLHAWGNGNGSTAGLQWTKIMGASEIVGLTGEAARLVTDPDTEGGESHITIEKHVRSQWWQIREMESNRTNPSSRDGHERNVYNDWVEVANVTANPAPNARKFTAGENIAVLAEYGDTLGHTADPAFVPSTEMEIEGRVIRTIFKFTSTDKMLAIQDGHSLGSIQNIIFKAEDNGVKAGVFLSDNSSLNDFERGADAENITKNCGVVGANRGWTVHSGSSLYGKNLVAATSSFDTVAFGGQGFFTQDTGSYMDCRHSVALGFEHGFYSNLQSELRCDYSLAGHCNHYHGWLGFKNNFDFSTIPVPGYIYQENGLHGVEFVGKITHKTEQNYRVNVAAITYGLPNLDTGSYWLYMNANQAEAEKGADGAGSVAVNRDTDLMASYIHPRGVGFYSWGQSTTYAPSCIATGLGGHGFVVGMDGLCVCNKSVASEIMGNGYDSARGKLNAIDSVASRTNRGYYLAGAGNYVPYTMAVNNVSDNVFVVTGHSETAHTESAEGFDMALITHKTSTNHGQQIGTFYRGTNATHRVYNSAQTNNTPYDGGADGARGDGDYNVGPAHNKPNRYHATLDGMIDFTHDENDLASVDEPITNALGHTDLGGQ